MTLTVSKIITTTTTDDIPANVSKHKSRKPKRRPIRNGQRYILELEYPSHEYKHAYTIAQIIQFQTNVQQQAAAASASA